MAKPVKTRKKTPAQEPAAAEPKGWRNTRKWLWRGLAIMIGLVAFVVLLFSLFNPPVTMTMISEGRRTGGIEREWVDLEDIAPVMARSVVAAEDANFCLHWGFDMAAIRQAMNAGGQRGASTLSQQVVKNVYLWQGRSWPRKAMEAVLTPLVEMTWSKRRILEVYLNVAEMGEGVFGVQAAAQHWFGVDASALTPQQAARIAAILPDPRNRSAAKPSAFVQRRSNAIRDGAATIRADGRAACFED